MVSGHLACALNAVDSCLKGNNIILQYDPKQMHITNTDFYRSVMCNFSDSTLISPNTEYSILNSTTQNIYVKLMVLIAKPTSLSILLVEYVEAQPIHLNWDLKRRNLSSPWEGLIYAAVLSSSILPGAKGAKKIPCNWGKESRELSAGADLVQLAPIPHCSFSVQGISKPTAQPKEHDQPQQSFLLDPKTKLRAASEQYKRFFLIPIPPSLCYILGKWRTEPQALAAPF